MSGELDPSALRVRAAEVAAIEGLSSSLHTAELVAALSALADARDEIARLTAERDVAVQALAAIRALPPETVADVREAAERERAKGYEHPEYCARFDASANRLTALADALEVVRG